MARESVFVSSLVQFLLSFLRIPVTLLALSLRGMSASIRSIASGAFGRSRGLVPPRAHFVFRLPATSSGCYGSRHRHACFSSFLRDVLSPWSILVGGRGIIAERPFMRTVILLGVRCPGCSFMSRVSGM